MKTKSESNQREGKEMEGRCEKQKGEGEGRDGVGNGGRQVAT